MGGFTAYFITKLKTYVSDIAWFCHITDAAGQIDIVDLAFIGTMLKVIFAPGIDYPALGALVATIMSKMHADHLESKRSVPNHTADEENS